MAVAKRSDKNVVVIARAGSGKTTVAIEAMVRALRIDTVPHLTGSEEQEAIWEEVCKGPMPLNFLYAAFANRNARDVEQKMKQRGINDPRIFVKTAHAFGLFLLNRAGVCKLPAKKSREWVVKDKTERIMLQLLGVNPDKDSSVWTARKEFPGVLPLARKVLELVRMEMLDVSQYNPVELVTSYVDEYGIKADENAIHTVANNLADMLQMSTDLIPTAVDFVDMICAPVNLGLHKQVQKYSMCIIDEAQDLNRAQQLLLVNVASRYLVVGDDRQAVMGFQGADQLSLTHLTETMKGQGRGAVVLPMTVSRRCPRCVLPFILPIVPDFKVMPDAPEGTAYHLRWDEAISSLPTIVGLTEKVMMIGRLNAYGVSMAIQCIMHNIPCTILGRDFGNDLKDLIKSIAKDLTLNCEDFLALVTEWERREIERIERTYTVPDDMIILVTDKARCLTALASSNLHRNVQYLSTFIGELFQDESHTRITISSIHKAKGLEAPRIFFLAYDTCPDPRAMPGTPQYGQEENLWYVACTRTENQIYFISQPDETKAAVQRPNHISAASLARLTSTLPEVARAERATIRANSTQPTDNQKEERRALAIQELRATLATFSPEELDDLFKELKISLDLGVASCPFNDDSDS